MLALPLLCAAFEGETEGNEYTVPISPTQLASDIKDCWVGAGRSPNMNPIEKISVAVQQLSDQLVILPICCPAPPTMKTQVVEVDAVDGETGGDVDVVVDREMVLAANAGPKRYWASKYSIETENFFSAVYS